MERSDFQKKYAGVDFNKMSNKKKAAADNQANSDN